jgi:hypothetical protein
VLLAALDAGEEPLPEDLELPTEFVERPSVAPV